MSERDQQSTLPSSTERDMDEETLTALQESIAKWERLSIEGRVSGNASDDCPLCKKFYPENCSDWDWNGDKQPNNCNGCPVDTHTQGRGCIGTPCCKFFVAQENGHDNSILRAHAKDEVAFLKSLLPKVVA